MSKARDTDNNSEIQEFVDFEDYEQVYNFVIQNYKDDLLKKCDEVIEQNKDNTTILINFADALFEEQDSSIRSKAVEYFTKAHNLDKDNYHIAYSLAMLYSQNDSYIEAETYFNKAIEINIKNDSTDPECYFQKGLLLLKIGQPEQAIKALKAAVEKNKLNDDVEENNSDNEANYYFNLALAHSKLGKNQLAAGYLQYVLVLDPHYASAEEELSKIHHLILPSIETLEAELIGSHIDEGAL